ncbi:hypothetical protein [Acidithiobacillus thiooxidans]|jgi:hypothetical protein|uniref:hypothetical protein n=1 Tax=Acidithiobacillus thiooxidans TaxID=930 RepID=UPI001C07723F|nr:hypothetical protein [Acidithiobacillus thiooxidans]MDD2750221.1 hypothetical protein [Acidithiobacillus sp.]
MKSSKHPFSNRYHPIFLAILAVSPLAMDNSEADSLALPGPLTFIVGHFGTLNVQGVARGMVETGFMF